MRPLILLTLVLLIGGTTCAQADRLSLTTRITDQKYCGTDYTDMAMLRLSLQLTSKNDSARPLILYKGNPISYILVAADSERILARQYESDIHVGWVTTGPPTLREGVQPGVEFIVLQPGETFQTTDSVSVAVALESPSQFLKSDGDILVGVAGGGDGIVILPNGKILKVPPHSPVIRVMLAVTAFAISVKERISSGIRSS